MEAELAAAAAAAATGPQVQTVYLQATDPAAQYLLAAQQQQQQLQQLLQQQQQQPVQLVYGADALAALQAQLAAQVSAASPLAYQVVAAGNPAFAAMGAATAPAAGIPGLPSYYKPGDWNCPQCGDHQFSRNDLCRRCGGPKPADAGMMLPLAQVPGGLPEAKPGDWTCPNCSDLVFARNPACRRCGTTPDGTKGAVAPVPGIAPAHGTAGDWNCQQCGDLQFARNAQCRRCGAPRSANPTLAMPVAAGLASPAPYQRLGDWMCPTCNDLVFGKNYACRRCQTPRPANAVEVGPGMGKGGGKGGFAAAAAVSEQPQASNWMCPGCGDRVFAKIANCLRCQTPRPEEAAPAATMATMAVAMPAMPAAVGGKGSGPPLPQPLQKPGDWLCTQCGDTQFAKNMTCRRCGGANPMTAALLAVGITPTPAAMGLTTMPGDWQCTQCQDLQFARNTACRRCGASKPGFDLSAVAAATAPGGSGKGGSMRPGDWVCASCSDLQFARNTSCRRCGAAKPADTAAAATDLGAAVAASAFAEDTAASVAPRERSRSPRGA